MSTSTPTPFQQSLYHLFESKDDDARFLAKMISAQTGDSYTKDDIIKDTDVDDEDYGWEDVKDYTRFTKNNISKAERRGFSKKYAQEAHVWIYADDKQIFNPDGSEKLLTLDEVAHTYMASDSEMNVISRPNSREKKYLMRQGYGDKKMTALDWYKLVVGISSSVWESSKDAAEAIYQQRRINHDKAVAEFKKTPLYKNMKRNARRTKDYKSDSNWNDRYIRSSQLLEQLLQTAKDDGKIAKYEMQEDGRGRIWLRRAVIQELESEYNISFKLRPKDFLSALIGHPVAYGGFMNKTTTVFVIDMGILVD